jgi:hypothetical protein
LISYKLRLTSPGPEEAELLREALQLAFGEALKLAKARKGSNPKYEHLPDVLAYGTLTISPADLQAVIKRQTKRTKAPPAPKQMILTLAEPTKPRPRRKKGA